MLYLEDYLEMIEHLPQELRDRFTDMREMDLSVHNNMDELEKRVKTFFGECKKFQPNQHELANSLEDDFQIIRNEYYKTLEDADEKVQLANTMYDLVDKYLRRLDSELHKFKCELEADNKGITEILEKRSLELDTPQQSSSSSAHSSHHHHHHLYHHHHHNHHHNHHQKENRYEHNNSRNFTTLAGNARINRTTQIGNNTTTTTNTTTTNSSSGNGVVVGGTTSRRSEIATNQIADRKLTNNVPSTTNDSSTATSQSRLNVNNMTSTINYGHVGAGNAIAAAASQAIAATQQMQQGRRTASLKASYEAINNTDREFIPRELAGAAQTAIQAIHAQDHVKQHPVVVVGGGVKKQKKMTEIVVDAATASTSTNSSSSSDQQQHNVNVNVNVNALSTNLTESEAWTYDPNEPRYCLCNQISYGDMVACDNEECPSEWFHYPCVGITAPPKGKWFCPQCTTTMKRRGGSRKN